MVLSFFNKKLVLGLCISVGLTFNAVSLASPVNFVPEVHTKLSNVNKASVEWEKGENNDIQALGFGLPPIGSNHVRGKILARRAAIVDAQRNLLEYINGVSLDADTTVENLNVESDIIRSQVSGIVRNATIVSEKYNNDGSYQVVLSVPMYGDKKSLAAVVMPQMTTNLPSLEKQTYEIPYFDSSIPEGCTGVIVDAKGLQLEPTFSPVIYDTEGRIVYGLQKLDYNFVISHGVVEYSTNLADNTRAGKKPLIVKAIAVRGGKNSVNYVNVVVTKEDANKIILADKKNGLFKNCAVVFVK